MMNELTAVERIAIAYLKDTWPKNDSLHEVFQPLVDAHAALRARCAELEQQVAPQPHGPRIDPEHEDCLACATLKIDAITAELVQAKQLYQEAIEAHNVDCDEETTRLEHDLARVTGERDAAQDYIQNGMLKKMEEEGIELHKYEHKNYDKLFPNRDGLFWRTSAILAETAYTAAQERIAELEARLQIDHAYNAQDERIEIDPVDRYKFPDGIQCRDATIELQDKAIAQLKKREARLREALKDCLVYLRVVLPGSALVTKGEAALKETST